MKTNIYLATWLWILTSISIFAYDYSQPSAWEQRPDGVALSMVLGPREDGSEHKIVLYVYVKNTSNHVKFQNSIVGDNDIRVFYIGDDGKPKPLHDYPPPNNNKNKNINNMIIVTANIEPPEISPGQIWRTVVYLTDADETILLTHSAFFECDVADERAKNHLFRSSPVKLTLPSTGK